MLRNKRISIILIWAVILSAIFPSGIFAEPNPQFNEVEKMLDEGGNYYFYYNIKGILKQTMNRLQKIINGEKIPPETQKILSSLNQILETLGFYDIEDMGMSSIAVEDHFQVKTFIRIPEKRRGLLKLFGANPHPCHALDYAPKETLVLFTTDLCAWEIIPLIRSCCQETGNPEVIQDFDKSIANLNMNLSNMTGNETKIKDLAASLQGEIALLIDVDPITKMNIPLGRMQGTQLPSPRFALMLRVKDALLYETLFAMLKKTGMVQSEIREGDVRKIFAPVPPNPFYLLQPVLCHDGQYCILTTQSSLLDRILETKKTGNSLKTTEEYQQLMKGLPPQGNSFIFISKNAIRKFKDILLEIQKLSSAMMANDMPSFFLQDLEGDITMGIASVQTNTENGIWEIRKQQQSNPGMKNLMTGVAIAGILTAIAVPGFLRARDNARLRACQENLMKLDSAKEQWALENNKSNGAEVKMEDLIGEDKYILRRPVCPRGGTYTLGVIGEYPKCSCGANIPEN